MKRDEKRKGMCAIGFSLPLHCTGLGKALLMDFNEKELRSYYKDYSFYKLTQYSISNIDDLVKENKVNTFCIAAPIYDYRNKVIAALSSSWKEESNKIEEVSIPILQAANNISHRMGFMKRT